MTVLSYRSYLDLLEQKGQRSPFKSITSLLAVTLLLVIGIGGVLVFEYQKEAPVREKIAYLNVANSGFSTSDESLNELLNTLRIAGAKTQFVDELRDTNSASDGFTVALEDLEKTRSQIGQNKQSLENKLEALTEIEPPVGLEQLHANLLTFYKQSIVVLEDIQKDLLFSKNILIASGPNLYLPSLTEAEIWENPDEEKVVAFYEKSKEEANSSFRRLSELDPPDQFSSYHALQLSYLELLVKTADEIIITMKKEENQDEESATRVEESFQILTNSRKENSELAQKLLEERLRVLSVKENLNKLAPLEIQKNSIKEQVNLEAQDVPTVGNYNFKLPQLPDFFSLSGFKLR